MDAEYERFRDEMKQLLKEAERLNEYRNSIIHWRPFAGQRSNVRPAKLIASGAKEIAANAMRIDEVGTEIFARGVYLYKGDHSLTFGSHARGLGKPNLLEQTRQLLSHLH